MSNYHSAYSIETEQYLPDYMNREDGRKLVRDIIQNLVRDRLRTLRETDQLLEVVPEWAAAHPIALL
ncbi:MAG: hypothetical protein ABEK50_10895 [bacterium]